MRGLGFALTVVGLIALIATWMMDTSVAAAAGGRVPDVRLMADRQLYMLMAGIVLVAGILMVLFTGKSLGNKGMISKSRDDQHD